MQHNNSYLSPIVTKQAEDLDFEPIATDFDMDVACCPFKQESDLPEPLRLNMTILNVPVAKGGQGKYMGMPFKSPNKVAGGHGCCKPKDAKEAYHNCENDSHKSNSNRKQQKTFNSLFEIESEAKLDGTASNRTSLLSQCTAATSTANGSSSTQRSSTASLCQASTYAPHKQLRQRLKTDKENIAFDLEPCS